MAVRVTVIRAHWLPILYPPLALQLLIIGTHQILAFAVTHDSNTWRGKSDLNEIRADLVLATGSCNPLTLNSLPITIEAVQHVDIGKGLVVGAAHRTIIRVQFAAAHGQGTRVIPSMGRSVTECHANDEYEKESID